MNRGLAALGCTIGICSIMTISASAFISYIGSADADRALRIAKSSLAERQAFNNPYFLEVAASERGIDAPILERIEIITEFRRMEILAEQRLGVDATFGGGGTDEILEAIRPWRNQVAIVAHVRFTGPFVSTVPPPTTITMERQAPLKSSTRTIGGGKGSSPTGWETETAFDSTRIVSGVHTIIVSIDQREVARCQIDLDAFD